MTGKPATNLGMITAQAMPEQAKISLFRLNLPGNKLASSFQGQTKHYIYDTRIYSMHCALTSANSKKFSYVFMPISRPPLL